MGQLEESPTQDEPGERAAGERLVLVRRGKFPESKVSGLFLREGEAKPWAWLEVLPPSCSEDDGMAVVVQISQLIRCSRPGWMEL